MERGFIFHEFELGKITFQEVERDFVGRHSESGCDFGRGEGESCHRLEKKRLFTNKGYYSLILRVDHG